MQHPFRCASSKSQPCWLKGNSYCSQGICYSAFVTLHLPTSPMPPHYAPLPLPCPSIYQQSPSLSTPSQLLAGASQHALAEDTTPEVTQKLFQLNTLAPINLTQALLPYILQPLHKPGGSPAEDPQQNQQGHIQGGSGDGLQGGAPRGCHIVVVGSMAGKVPSPGQAVYSGCKTALMGYFASLSTELSAR